MTDIFCKIHPEHPIDHICLDDCALLCAECKDKKGAHNKCKTVVPLADTDVATLCGTALPKATAELQEQLHRIDLSGEVLELLDERQEALDKSVADAREKIQTAFSSIRSAIDAREAELLSKIEAFANESKFCEFGAELKSLSSAASLIEGDDDGDKDAIVRKIDAVKCAVERIKCATDNVFKAALKTSVLNISFDATKIQSSIDSFGEITTEEHSTPHSFQVTETTADNNDNSSSSSNSSNSSFSFSRPCKAMLEWKADSAVNFSSPLTYCVDVRDNYLKTFREAYSGTDCSCTVSNLEAENSYTFYLHVKIGELMSGAICEVSCDVVNRHFGPNGMLYCGGLLDRCRCGKCKSYVCGEGNGCQCTDCMNCQTTFYRAHPCTCLNNHPYRLGTCRDVDAYCEVLFCSVCRKIIYSEGSQAFFYMLMCENCLSFVCPACILRVMSPREKVLDGAVIPRFPPIGPPKHFVCEGSIYCGLLKNQCRCGMCDGRCGPTNGCACNECNELLKSLYVNAHLRCKKGHELSVFLASQRKKRIFKVACDLCDKVISVDGYHAFMPILSCPQCDFDVCPACIMKKIPIQLVPPNVYIYNWNKRREEENFVPLKMK